MSRPAALRITRRRAGLTAAAGVRMLLLPAQLTAAVPPWSSLLQKGPIVFRGDFPLEKVAEAIDCVGPTMLEAPKLLGLSPHRKPIAFYLLADEKSYRRYLAERLPGVGYRRSLFLQGRGHPMVFAQRGPHLTTDLRHEATHAALHTLWTDVPLWLDEGLAEYLEAAPNHRVAGHPWMAALRKLARQNDLPRLAPLEQIDRAASFDDADYRAAWAWIHFFLNGPAPARETFREYCLAWDRYDTASRQPDNAALGGAARTSLRPGKSVKPVQPEPLSARLARQMPDWPRQFQRHFADQ